MTSQIPELPLEGRLGGWGSAPPIPHHLQYAMIHWVGVKDQDSTLVWGTENMDDSELLKFVRKTAFDRLTPIAQRFLRHIGKLPEGEFFTIERYDCCYVCLERSPCRVYSEQSQKSPSLLERLRLWRT